MRALLRRMASALLDSRVALFGVLGAGALAGFAFLGVGGSEHTVVAQFTDINGLVKGNEVRIAGIEAGKVSDIQLRHDPKGLSYAQVTLTIQDQHWPLHKGTLVAVRPKGVLSNVFVSVIPGPDQAPALTDGYTFDTGHTSSPVNLDEALNDVFTNDVRQAIRTQIHEGTIALGGSGAGNLNGTLQNLNPLTSHLSPITQALAERSPELDRLNGEFATITSELASEDANLRGVIENADTTLAALVAKQQDLQGTLVHAAGTFQSLNQVIDGEQQNLVTIFQKGPAALDKAKQSADLFTPLLTTINPHIPHLDILLHQLVTASGYRINGLDTLRVDGSTPLPGRSASACGGEPSEQPNCATKVSSGGAPAGAGQAATASDPTAAQQPLGPIFGGLFG